MKLPTRQRFGSGSMWIRIEIASLDQDAYLEYGFRIRVKYSETVVQKRRKKVEITS